MKRLALVVAILATLCTARVVEAVPITFSSDTSALLGRGVFGFDLILVDGDGVANTTVAVDLFDLGGGSPAGAPSMVGSASGSLSSRVVLTDGAFLNAFTQSFLPGSTIGFRVDVTTTASGLPQPEGFQVSILDAAGNPIATNDASGLNALILAELSASTEAFQLFEIVAVPEPVPVALVAMAALVSGWLRRRTDPDRAFGDRT
jgi:hypothetical protein